MPSYIRARARADWETIFQVHKVLICFHQIHSYPINERGKEQMPRSVRQIIVARNSGRILGWALTFLGLTPIIVVLLNAWTSGISLLDLSALYEYLWAKRFSIGFGIEFELIYLIIAGTVAILVGVLLLARRTEHVEELTVVTEDLTVTLECTVCKNRWKEEFSKTHLQSMGFPQNRTISRRKCLACGKFTRPKIVSM